MLEPYRLGVLNDLHIPLHDPRSVNLVLDIFEDLQLEEIILNGDVLDCYLLNSHGPKHPDFQGTLEWEYELGNKFLDTLQKKCPTTKITYIFGNHEQRLDRYVINNCPHFWNVLKTEKMLRLEDRKIDFIAYNKEFRVGETSLNIQHSPPSYGESGARTSLLKKPGRSYIYGCTHRMQAAHINSGKDKVESVYFNGWLGSTTLTPQHEAVYHFIKNHNTWQQCFSIVTVRGRDHFVQQYQIKDYRASVDGYLYEG